jgi:MFS family permease
MTINTAVGTKSGTTRGMIIARQDRLTTWAMPPFMLFVIGIGFLFTFYDIFDINVSFIQTCIQIVPGCNPEVASRSIGVPVLMNLVGYVIGALGLSAVADRFGRKNTMLLTLVITGIGSLYSGLSNDIVNFTTSRFITGIGIGADLAVVNTYIGEMSPSGRRASYTSLIFIMSALGAFVGIWLGLILTTEPTPFPMGLSIAQAGPGFSGNGWRFMYLLGTVLSVIGIGLRSMLPESPRWLASNDRLEQADAVVSQMEAYAARTQPLPPVTSEAEVRKEERASYREIFGNQMYLRRMLLLLVMWFLAYITIYTIAAGFTSVLTSLGYPPPEAGLIAAVGTLGFIACAVFAFMYGERLERKYWLPVMAVVTLVGGILVALSPPAGPGQIPWLAFVGSIVLFFGFNGWVPQTYAWSAENFPTRARVTGFGLVDGVGHVGGGVGLIAIAPLLPQIGVLASMILISSFLIAAAIIAQFGVATRGRNLDEVSP